MTTESDMTGVGRDRTRPTVTLVALCENYIESLETECPGLLRYRWGMSQAACETCGGWCGISVADWWGVER